MVAAQFASCGSAAENRRSIRAVLDRCGGDLVVLPEASQMAFGEPGSHLAAGAEPIDGPFVSMLIDASRPGRTIVAGMFEDVGADRPFNTSVVVRDGELVGRYRKLHLYDALGFVESAGVAPGPIEDGPLVVDLGDLTMGVMTCFDLRFPEVAASLCGRGADLLVLGAAWVPGPRKPEQWEALLAARAIETTSYLIAAAQPGPRYCGMSRIIDPRGESLASAGATGTCELAARLSSQVIREVRATMPVLELKRLGGV